MTKDDSKSISLGARELTERELTLIRGGGLLGDLWDDVKSGVNAVVNTIIHPVDTILAIPNSLPVRLIKQLYHRSLYPPPY